MIVIRRQILHQELERVQARFEPDRRHRRHRRRRRRRLVVNGVLHTITESALQLKIHWSNFLKEKKVVFFPALALQGMVQLEFSKNGMSWTGVGVGWGETKARTSQTCVFIFAALHRIASFEVPSSEF